MNEQLCFALTVSPCFHFCSDLMPLAQLNFEDGVVGEC